MSECFSVCLSWCLDECLNVCLYVCLNVFLCDNLSVWIARYSDVWMFFWMSRCWDVCLPVSLSPTLVLLDVYLSLFMSGYLCFCLPGCMCTWIPGCQHFLISGCLLCLSVWFFIWCLNVYVNVSISDRMSFWFSIWLYVLISDGTAEAEALTRDLFGWKRERKQLNQTASASSYYIDYTAL